MPNTYFSFKQFTIQQDRCSMKVTTDACLFGAWVSDKIKNDATIKDILDIGSGTGLLSLMLAQQSAATITGIELQHNDYVQSLENIAASPWSNQIQVINADAAIFTYHKKYDTIISNPPFYENFLIGPNRYKNIAHHNTGLTLHALITLIKQQLQPNGRFYLLLPAVRENEIEAIINNAGMFINRLMRVHQTQKHDAFRVIIEGSFTNSKNLITRINIKENETYSNSFVALLNGYYLHL